MPSQEQADTRCCRSLKGSHSECNGCYCQTTVRCDMEIQLMFQKGHSGCSAEKRGDLGEVIGVTQARVLH